MKYGYYKLVVFTVKFVVIRLIERKIKHRHLLRDLTVLVQGSISRNWSTALPISIVIELIEVKIMPIIFTTGLSCSDFIATCKVRSVYAGLLFCQVWLL